MEEYQIDVNTYKAAKQITGIKSQFTGASTGVDAKFYKTSGSPSGI